MLLSNSKPINPTKNNFAFRLLRTDRNVWDIATIVPGERRADRTGTRQPVAVTSDVAGA